VASSDEEKPPSAVYPPHAFGLLNPIDVVASMCESIAAFAARFK
jgi:hypothetical protein